ncbi:hypothetical protein T01_5996 [Trichinella spiralis]|uniref:Uncharacterized protein n=1 Tax=Trichinella spiralis TaxID=6334 RepID=A0A0V1AKN5_TRISP|nr:hypothetical protein T01_5996 [Trichinella spiralis]
MERSRSTILYFLREGSVVFHIDGLNNHARKVAHDDETLIVVT